MKPLEIQGLKFQWDSEGSLWLVWNKWDHRKFYAKDAKKILRFLKRKLETKQPAINPCK